MQFNDKNRQVVPRLRTFKITAALGELGGESRQQRLSADHQRALAKSLRDWNEDNTIWTAAEAISAAFILGVDCNRPAIEFLLRSGRDCPSVLRAFAEGISKGTPDQPCEEEDPTDNATLGFRISQIRHRLDDEPRNAIQWIELARLYLLLGQRRSALRAVTAAGSGTTNNRFILRSAARIFLHLREGDRAVTLLRNSPTSRTDPWVIAAEIATSLALGMPSLRAMIGRKKCEDNSFSEFDRTELASALGTAEMFSGNMRHARRLFRQSLGNPNENSMAQAEWASRQIGDIGLERVRQDSIQMLYEAPARARANQGDWQSAMTHGAKWLHDQYFSKQPALFLSYIATIAEKYDDCINITRQCLKLNPGDPVLINNLCFALGRTGKTKIADETMKDLVGAERPIRNRIAQTATLGLIRFRQGAFADGRRMYHDAIAMALMVPNGKQLYIMANLNLAREELFAHGPGAIALAREALDAVPGNATPDVKEVALQLEQDLKIYNDDRSGLLGLQAEFKRQGEMGF